MGRLGFQSSGRSHDTLPLLLRVTGPTSAVPSIMFVRLDQPWPFQYDPASEEALTLW